MMHPADLAPGQTVLCNGAPSVIWRTGVTPRGQSCLTFLVPNRDRVIQWIVEPDELVAVAPLALA